MVCSPVGEEPGVNYAAAAQGIRSCWKRAPDHPDMRGVVKTHLGKCQTDGPEPIGSPDGCDRLTRRCGKLHQNSSTI